MPSSYMYNLCVCFILFFSQLEVHEQHIKVEAPGEAVFDPDKYLCLMSFPGNLTLASCGYTPGNSQVDRTLSSLAEGDT